ncbi:outer membrane protein [Sphingomonas sp. PAMC 26621]|uniref:outer membrane protein n=1 Tax=Sphingomonas sp. PAMC 26621 TaxID=1112213 RepID=UPI000288AF48|nr:outer membrane beta-barrel protein [Sphingomonas sp. PAMC 26621]
MTCQAVAVTFVGIVAILSAPSASAQARSYTGPFAGIEAGAREDHVFFDVANLDTGETLSRYYRAVGPSGGAFVGYDVAVAQNVRIGGEVGVNIGGGRPVARLPDSRRFFEEHPRYGYRLSLRAGYLATPRLLLYATGGYGGNRYRIDFNPGIPDIHQWGSSFIVGGGMEYRFRDRTAVRIDFKHVDNQASQLMLGVPIRF